MHEHNCPGDAGEEEDAHNGHQDGQEGPGQKGEKINIYLESASLIKHPLICNIIRCSLFEQILLTDPVKPGFF